MTGVRPNEEDSRLALNERKQKRQQDAVRIVKAICEKGLVEKKARGRRNRAG